MLETRKLPDNILMETIPCDLCGADDYSIWDRARSNTLVKCNQCGLVYTNPRIANSEDKDKYIYTDTYFSQKSRMTEDLVRARQNSHRMEITALERYVKGGKIMDVGCGMGIFLDSFNDNWERHGCDVSSYGLQEAGKRGIKTYHGEFEKLDFGDDKFDVVYFRASLHHAYAPKKCIEKAINILAPGGMIVITMSNNCGGICGKMFRAHVKSYEQAHNYLFSTSTLQKYFENVGMDVIDTNFPYFGTGYESIMDFIELPIRYIQYLYLKVAGKLNREGTFDFCSPTFYGNYVNIYARKKTN